jgi:arylsulfatase A-like enzyme
LAAVLLLISGCEREGGAPLSTPTDGETRTVVLVTLDTWRRDTSGFLGGLDPSPTPFLDDLAATGLVATDAMAPVPLTGPSHWSMLSGRWPWRDGLRVNGEKPRPGRATRLAGLLREEGWRTAAFVSCLVLDHRLGFATGFEHYDDRFGTEGQVAFVEMTQRRGDLTVQAALDWTAAQPPDDRLFLWVHLFDPHFPRASRRGSFAGEHGDYRGAVAFADAQLERLARGLGQADRPLEASLWVVLSDHGEGLGAHGENTHGQLLHGATTRIPFFVAGPSIEAGRFETLASTVDVFPTILGYLGLEIPESDGIDLLHATGSSERAIPLESLFAARAYGLAPALGIRSESWLWEASPTDHLWDLASDPEEERDLAGERAERVALLRERRWEIGVPDFEQAQPQDPEMLESLHALGYVDSGLSPGTGDVRVLGPEAANLRSELRTLLNSRRYAEAEVLARRSIERHPRSHDSWLSAGFVSVGLRDLPEAERRFRTAVDLAPDHTQPRLNLANVHLELGRLDEAEAGYRRTLQSDPENFFALYNLGTLLARRDRFAEAMPYWRRFAELYPENRRAAGVRRKLERWAAKAPSR